MFHELPRCFADSAWTVVHPELRAEIKKRVRSRFPRALVSHADESDVVQDALDAAFHHRVLLKRLSPPQRSSWFWVVVSRLSIHLKRRRSKAVAVELLKEKDARRLPDQDVREPASVLVKEEQVSAVREALATLPEPWRRVIALRDSHPDDWGRVAAECGLSTGAARALWYRAIAGLRERLLESDCFRDEGL
jgi:RNA polymerase sigma factor (sigma-70 family)